MLKHVLGLAVGACYMQEAETQRTASVAALSKDKPLSGVIIKAFFDGSDAKKVAEKVAQAEGSRLQYLLRTFPNTDVNGVKEAVKDYKAMAAKEHGGDKAAAKVITTRTGEVQALYGAWRFGEFKPEGVSYHDAVASARNILKSRSIRWDGARIPEKWERDVRKQVEGKAQVELAARMEIERAERTSGKEMPDEEREAIYARAQEAQAKADMVVLARGLFKKYGAEKCEQLIEVLESTIAAEQQAAKDKAGTAKEAKAA